MILPQGDECQRHFRSWVFHFALFCVSPLALPRALQARSVCAACISLGETEVKVVLSKGLPSLRGKASTMAGRPPPSYNDAVNLPGGVRMYEGYVPAASGAAVQQAVHHAECPVCFEQMHAEQSGVMTASNGKRVCPHFMHLRCLNDIKRGGGSSTWKCPMCRAGFANVEPVPKLETDPSGWFKVVDMNGDGGLSRDELKYVLLAQIAIDEVILEEELAANFKKWDKNRDGVLKQDELMGLINYLREKARPVNISVPDIKKDKHAWYNHYDEDKNGSLQQDEVVRGLIQTFRFGHDPQRMQAIKQTVQAVWCIFDNDGSGSIEKDEFLRAGDGLADTIIATLGH